MSSSPSRARVLPAVEKATGGESGAASPFPYSHAVAAPGQRNFPLAEPQGRAQGAAGGGESDASTAASRGAEREAQLTELGRQQGAAACQVQFEERLAGERTAVAQALKDFARERGAYYQKLEEETVRLALSIARKVLHREAQVDPLLLMGIVRVALEKIESATGVSLVVHPQRAEEWRRYLATSMDAAALPEIVEDAAMGLAQCGLRTAMGTADLSVELQLKEIEQGLMDLLAARPQEKSQEKLQGKR
jgi:flagellar assembly protein FliH